MSFKPIFAKKIIEGSMDCEVRTFFKPLDRNDTIILYASSPMKSFIALFSPDKVFTGKYDDIVDYIRINCKKFDKDNWFFIRKHYMRSKRKLIAFKIANIEVFKHPIRLETIRSIYSRFKPPIGYTYIDKKLFETIVALAYEYRQSS